MTVRKLSTTVIIQKYLFIKIMTPQRLRLEIYQDLLEDVSIEEPQFSKSSFRK